MFVRIMENDNPASMVILKLSEDRSLSLKYLKGYFHKPTGIKYKNLNGEWIG
jgi:hypothetical protein